MMAEEITFKFCGLIIRCNTYCRRSYYGRPLSVAWAKSMLCFANVIYLFIFHGRLMLRPRLTEVRETFTCGGPGSAVAVVNKEVTIWIFSWSSLNYRVGQKVTKFGIFSDPARKLFW